jgi:glycosyltransferase 2 family protein
MRRRPLGRGGNRLRNALRLLVGITVSGACLYFATRGTDWARVGEIVTGARPIWVLGIVVAGLLGVYVRAQRWRVLLRPLGDVPLYPALSATAIGFGASAVLPFRLGELVRPAILGRRIGCGMSAALSSVVLERLFDMLLVIGCFLAVTLLYPVIGDDMRRGALVLSALAVLGFVVLFLVQRNPAVAETLITRLLDRLPRRVGQGLLPVARSFLSGLGGLSDARTVLLVLWYSAYLWSVITASFAFGFLALGIQVPILAVSLTTVVVVAAFVFLPQAPGFVGTWQAGCVVALGLFGVPKDIAVGYSILTWIVSMATNVGAAGFFLAREDMSLGQLVRSAASEAPSAGTGG